MKKQDGLTLIELLIYIAILGIITMMSVSGFQAFINHKKSDAYLEQLKSFIGLAQKIAIDKKQTVTICPSINHDECDTKDWSQELIMFIDVNSNKKVEGNDVLIEVMPGVKSDVLSYSGFGSQTYIQFEPNGFFSSSNGTFRYCSMVGGVPDIQGIYISRTGRIRDAVDADGNSTLNDAKITSCQQLSN